MCQLLNQSWRENCWRDFLIPFISSRILLWAQKQSNSECSFFSNTVPGVLDTSTLCVWVVCFLDLKLKFLLVGGFASKLRLFSDFVHGWKHSLTIIVFLSSPSCSGLKPSCTTRPSSCWCPSSVCSKIILFDLTRGILWGLFLLQVALLSTGLKPTIDPSICVIWRFEAGWQHYSWNQGKSTLLLKLGKSRLWILW